MNETEMSVIISEYLRERGYRVFAEVAARWSVIDLVADRDDIRWPVAIELKPSLTRSLIRQAMRAGMYTPFAWAIVATRPRNPERITRHCVGLASVKGGHVQVIAKPRFDRPWRYSGYCLEPERGIENGNGGVPSPAPAANVARKLRAYLQGNIPSSWQEIYDNVPNHYAHARSMRGSMRAHYGFEHVHLPLRQTRQARVEAGQLPLPLGGAL